MLEPEQTENDRAKNNDAALARDLAMDKFTRRVVVSVLVFVLGSVAIAGVPLVIVLYRSVFGS